ncbi:hypothetical protein MPSEU_000260400 [Mayamaea pseudoterrestris]|nr:hypothetical protein MPSEU_000260400 [Mayamaea pseudoterrestris]
MCNDASLTTSPGIDNIECVTNPSFDGNPNQLNITSVTFLELDQNLQLLTSSTVTNDLKNGDTVEFASFTVNPDQATLTKVPSTIEVGIMAQDADGNSILTNWVVSFSNACDAYPVISVGDTIGWTEFANVRPPPGSLCPLAATPTTAPSAGAPTTSTTAPTGEEPTTTTSEPTASVATPKPSTKAPSRPQPPTLSPGGSVAQPTGSVAQPTLPSTKAPTTLAPVTPSPTHPLVANCIGSGSSFYSKDKNKGAKSNVFYRDCYYEPDGSKAKMPKGSLKAPDPKVIKGSKGYSKAIKGGSWSVSGSRSGLYRPAPTHPPTVPPQGGGSVATPLPVGSQAAAPTAASQAVGSQVAAAPTTTRTGAPSPSAMVSVPWVDQPTTDDAMVSNTTDDTFSNTPPPVTQVDDDDASPTVAAPTMPSLIPPSPLSPGASGNNTLPVGGGPSSSSTANSTTSDTSTIAGIVIGGGLVMLVMGFGVWQIKRQRSHGLIRDLDDDDLDGKRAVDMSSSESTMGLTSSQDHTSIYHLESHEVDDNGMNHDLELDPLAPQQVS